MGEYITDSKSVTMDVINGLCTQENLGDDFYQQNVKFDNAYLVKAKPGIEIKGNCPYSVVIVYNAYTNHHKTEYFICKFDDVVARKDGSICFGSVINHVQNEDYFGGGAVSYFSSAEEACSEIENNFGDRFTVERIDF